MFILNIDRSQAVPAETIVRVEAAAQENEYDVIHVFVRDRETPMIAATPKGAPFADVCETIDVARKQGGTSNTLYKLVEEFIEKKNAKKEASNHSVIGFVTTGSF